MGLSRELTLAEVLAPFARRPRQTGARASAALEKQFPERWADPAA
jgi:hypothetical protein